MRRVLCTLAMCLLCLPAAAQTVAVQSGEHADFSRVVLLFRDVPDWAFGRVRGGYELRPASGGARYDLGRVFDFIPRDRIEAVEARTDGRLFFRVGCDCHADAFEIRTGLVIDIKDGGAPRRARFEADLPPMEDDAQGAGPPPDKPPGDPAPDRAAVLDLPLVRDLADLYPAARTPHAWREQLAVPAPVPRGAPSGDTAPARAGDAVDDRVAEIQQALIAQIARAASQGMVEADLRATEARVDAAHPDVKDPEGETIRPDPLPAPQAADTTNVRFQTAIDRAREALDDSAAITLDGIRCLPVREVDIASWGNPPEPGAPLPLDRAGIVGERGEPDPQGITRLARGYLYLTFGAEARAVIAGSGAEVPGAATLLAMADIMDAGSSASPALPADHAACESGVALWALLAADPPPGRERVATGAVLSAFGGFPVHLRRYLGPMLAARFLQIGDPDAAATIQAAIARAPGAHGDSVAMMQAEIAAETGQSAEAAATLDRLVEEEGPLAPEALVRSIDTRIAAGRPLPPHAAETARSMAVEARGTALGRNLVRAAIRADAHGGNLRAAQEAIADALARDELAADTALALRIEIIALATADAPDEVFLKAALSDPLALGRSAEAAGLRRDVARRLIGLGLPAAARKVLAEDTDLPSPEDRFLFAQGFLAERRPDLAMGYLAGLTDADAQLLRAEVHEAAGEHGRAREIFLRLGDEDAAGRAAWRAQDWPQVAGPNSEARIAAARLAAGGTGGGADPAGPLARSRGFLTRSAEARRILGTLLAETEGR